MKKIQFSKSEDNTVDLTSVCGCDVAAIAAAAAAAAATAAAARGQIAGTSGKSQKVKKKLETIKNCR